MIALYLTLELTSGKNSKLNPMKSGVAYIQYSGSVTNARLVHNKN